MTPLEALIRRRIAADGPMPVAEYMALCLGHPEHGYYLTRDPLGRAGDFVTAPEVSQMFGELIGLWLAQVWLDLGAPPRAVLAELGPGRGTLMADALRAAARVPGFAGAAQLWLVETSPALRARQSARLPAARHADRLEQVPDDAPLLLVANEFFDALPIRQWVRTGGRWRERMVGLEGDRLAFGLGPVLPGGEPAPEGALREACPAGEAVAAEIGRRLAARGGAALILDYGAQAQEGRDTLQAVRAHRYADPLEAPGEADLTAHVDFGALARAAEAAGAVPAPLATQGAFLEALAITARAQALARAAPGRAAEIAAAHRRLTHPEAMGTLFKVLALTGPRQPPPPGFPLPQGPAR